LAPTNHMSHPSTVLVLVDMGVRGDLLHFAVQDFIEPTCAIMARAYVHPPVEFQDAPESEGSDVYLCEYEYDAAWKRFRKRRYGDGGPDDVSANPSCPVTPAGEAPAECESVW
jgi:hypothetical protein